MTTAAPAQQAEFQVVPAKAALGAEIRRVDLRTIDAATFAELHRSWLQHVMLVFRGQSLDAQDLVTLVRRFGTPVASSNLHKRDLKERAGNELFDLPPEVTVVSNVKQDGKSVGILGDGEVVWHSDFSFKERPTAARMLVAMEIPAREKGGSTFFLSCYAAYDALSPGMKKRISGMTIKQADIIDTAMKVRPGMACRPTWTSAPYRARATRSSPPTRRPGTTCCSSAGGTARTSTAVRWRNPRRC